MLHQQQIARRQYRAVGDVEIVAALDAEALDLVSLEQERAMVAGGIEAAFGDDDETAIKIRFLRRRGQAFQAPVRNQSLEVRRHGDRFAARQQTIAANIETDDLMDALDADVKHAGVFGERLGVVPTVRRERLAVGAENGRHLGVGDTRGLAAFVDDAAAQP